MAAKAAINEQNNVANICSTRLKLISYHYSKSTGKYELGSNHSTMVSTNEYSLDLISILPN